MTQIKYVLATLAAISISGAFGIGYWLGIERGKNIELDKWNCVDSPKVKMERYTLSEFARNDVYKEMARRIVISDRVLEEMDLNKDNFVQPLEHHTWRLKNHLIGN